MIKNTSPDNSGNSESLKNNGNSLKSFQLMGHTWQGVAEGVLQFALFPVLGFKWSVKKHCAVKVLQDILHENNRNCNSYRFSYKFAFIFFLPSLTNQEQESSFQQVGGLVTRNISAFSWEQVVLFFKGMPNSIYFYKGIFLHVIPAYIIVPWYMVEI